jgi:hypothetical protein
MADENRQSAHRPIVRHRRHERHPYGTGAGPARGAAPWSRRRSAQSGRSHAHKAHASSLLHRDEWSSLRAPSPTAASLPGWTTRSSRLATGARCRRPTAEDGTR